MVNPTVSHPSNNHAGMIQIIIPVDFRLGLRFTVPDSFSTFLDLPSETFYQTRIQIPGKAHTGTIDRLPMHASQTEIHISFACLREMRVEKRSQRSSNLLHSSCFHGWWVRTKASHDLALSSRVPYDFGCCYPAPFILTDQQLFY